MRPPIIELQGACKYWGEGENTIRILDNVHLGLYQGESVAIMGPSGAGKSTLMHVLAFLTSLDRGTISFKGTVYTGEKRADRSRLLKQISFIFQDAKLIPSMTVWENIGLPLIHRGIAKKVRSLLIENSLEQLSLAHRDQHYPNQLSGGEMMRVAIARAIITRPQVIFADEPTGSLDSKLGETIARLLYSLVDQQTALVVVTHQQEMADKADRIIHMKDSRISWES